VVPERCPEQLDVAVGEIHVESRRRVLDDGDERPVELDERPVEVEVHCVHVTVWSVDRVNSSATRSSRLPFQPLVGLVHPGELQLVAAAVRVEFAGLSRYAARTSSALAPGSTPSTR